MKEKVNFKDMECAFVLIGQHVKVHSIILETHLQLMGVRLLLYCSYIFVEQTIQTGNELNPARWKQERAAADIPFFCSLCFCRYVSQNLINLTFKDRKDKGLTVLVSFVLNQLFSSHVRCLMSAKLRVSFKVQ